MTGNQRFIEASFTSISVVRRLVVLLLGLLLWLPSMANAGQTSLALVSARDNIAGGMMTAQSVYADETRIYLATVQGTLFVLGRDRAANFPLLESIHYTSALYAVRGDSQNVYVATGDGRLLVYRKDPQLALVQALPLASNSLSSLAVTDDRVFVAVGTSTRFAVNDGRVYLGGSNDGDMVIELSKPALTSVRTYSEPFYGDETIAFDRQTGARVAAISPGNWNLYASETFVIGTDPGCCGAGIFVRDANSLALDQFIGRSWTNTVVQRDGFLIAGSEAGRVDVFDSAGNPSALLATVDLRQLTGHTGNEDIEIRALWADNLDHLVFAGSSWGNDQSRGPTLPSFFVLESQTSVDATPPTVNSVTPTNGRTGVNTATPVIAAFSELMDVATLTTSTFALRNPANAVVAATISFDSGSGWSTLTPSAALASSTKYTATITGGGSGVKDLAGNALASSVTWSFTTADTTPPTVTSVTPANGVSGVSAAAAVTATFSEAINIATLTTSTFVLRNPANAVVTATVSYNAGTRVGTLVPSAALAASTTYTATLAGSGSGVKDTAGNALASNFVWSFTTAPALTVGLTTIGSLLDSRDSNSLNGSKVKTSAGGHVVSMSVYVGNVDSLTANRQYQLAIYTNNAGRPGTLVARSASRTLVANAWNTVGISASLQPSTNYWFVFNTNGRTSSVNNMRYNSGNAGQGARSTALLTFGNWPTTFPAATTDNFVFSLFATFGP